MLDWEMSDEEARKILAEFSYEYSTKNNLSQLGGLRVLLEILKRGKYRQRLKEQLGPYKARTILQSLLGLWAGARTMVEIGQTGKDPLVRKLIEDPIEEAQLGRDYRSFTREEIEALHDFNVSQTVLDLVQKTPQTETLFFDIDSTSLEKYGENLFTPLSVMAGITKRAREFSSWILDPPILGIAA